MPWRNVTETNIINAMNSCDRLGLDAFRDQFPGFQPAENLYMYYPGRAQPYEARPLIAAAYADQNPGAPGLVPSSFDGINGHDFLIERFHFNAQQI
jgi:hypothetical protein